MKATVRYIYEIDIEMDIDQNKSRAVKKVALAMHTARQPEENFKLIMQIVSCDDESLIDKLSGACCEMMKQQITKTCEKHPNNNCPEVIMTQAGPSLPIHDGGDSYLPFLFCPWCGHRK